MFRLSSRKCTISEAYFFSPPKSLQAKNPMKPILLRGSLILSLSVWSSSAALQFMNADSTVVANLTWVAYDGQATFLVVGTNSTTTVGTFATDHIQWATHPGPSSASLYSATYGNGVFLVGADNGKVHTSPEGTHWGVAVSPFQNSPLITGVSFNPRSSTYLPFVAVAAVVEIAYSNSAFASAWTVGYLATASFLESFRGVAPLGTNGFVACGVLGGVRVSSNGGANWSNNCPISVTNPDLNGVASDGTNKIVAVGDGGAVWYSSNSGSTWNRQTTTGTDLNAVAYDRAQSCWLAVGNQGVILTSSDGTSWVRPNDLSGNFRAVAFGDTGTFQGVGVLVGDAGRIVLAGTAPAPPTSLGDIICCEGSGPQPMQVSSNATFSNPLVTVDWYAVAAGGSPVATNTFTFYAPNTVPPPNHPATNFYYAQARDLRTGFTSSTRTKIEVITGVTCLSVTTWPLAQTAEQGGAVSFQAQTETPALGAAYQWFFGETERLIGATNAVLKLTGLQPGQAGFYTVVVTNMGVVVTSTPACLSVIAPVARTNVPALKLTGEPGNLLHVEYTDSLTDLQWCSFSEVMLARPQYWFDLSQPQPGQRFYRAWQTNEPPPTLDAIVATAILLSGPVGASLRIDYIDAIGPTNAWVTLDTVTLTNTTQVYFDVGAFRQPTRLYRLEPVP